MDKREDTLLTSRQQIQILKNALCLSNDQMFGLRLGKCLTPTTHGAMGFMASSSPNLLATLKAFQTYLPTRVVVVK
ncbi:AraC family transcriptional regulator ligand-binding domain-containing protein [Zhongshania sp.]|uniref:AraC family transcriptional regulator ligand-binding domain-containing protein n=1 Tax=Zhongshania sp. TaxID=1971902 RepID=UPI003566128C